MNKKKLVINEIYSGCQYQQGVLSIMESCVLEQSDGIPFWMGSVSIAWIPTPTLIFLKFNTCTAGWKTIPSVWGPVTLYSVSNLLVTPLYGKCPVLRFLVHTCISE